ncbi:alpha/beta fold hydrolase [Bacillus cereus group sp. BfR-BA-01310]|uniref:alpha/beta fold hydrolase n=1 Tax=Bacillus cereus group sp. BfR-BA-01310 TaxID=2920287 RepID=UPI001F5891FB|nr:alpha/beta hydrolase [Bacillus cereus group sp. BfR-BA-01310]
MWEKQSIETERGIFEYFKKGKGKPICITHLYSEYNEKGNLFASLFVERYTVYLINLRGCGNSTHDISEFEFSMADSVEDLEAIRKALRIEKWSFAGHSTGGMLALKYTILYPESLIEIIAGGLCASSNYARHKGSIYCAKNPNNARLKEIFKVLHNPSSTLEERRAASKEWLMMSLYNEKAYDEMMNRPNSGKTVSKRLDYFSYEELPTYDLRPQLKDVQTLAYIYSGLYDAQCPHEYAVEAANLMPNATMTTFEKSNHFPFVEEEAEFKAFLSKIVI